MDTVTAVTEIATVASTGGIPYMVIVSVIGVINLSANILTMFIPDNKVSGYAKPVVSVLNILAGNIFNNKNRV